MKIREKYYNKIVRYDLVIEFLQFLKITQAEVDLSPLLVNIEQAFRDKRALFVKDYEELWIKEVIDTLDIINNKIIPKESKANPHR